MTLSEWISAARDKTDEQIADVTAQLFAICCGSGGRLSAGAIDIVFPDGSGFGTLVRSEENAEYEQGFCPPVYDGGDIRAGNVYVCALLLYKMLYGDLPAGYSALVQRCAIAASGGGSAAVLTAEKSRFGALLEAASQISTDKRITAEAALDMLAAMRESSAVVNIVEEETGARVDGCVLRLDSAFTRWEPRKSYFLDGQEFFPSADLELNIPYRLNTAAYTCAVRAAEYSAAARIRHVPLKGTVCVGLDLGACSSEISLPDGSGRFSEKTFDGRISLPSIAVKSGNRYVFGSGAVKLRESGIAAVRCFAGAPSGGDCEEAAAELIGFIRSQAQDAAGHEKAVTAGIAFSGGGRTRALIDEAAKAVGWDVYFTDGAAAAGLYFREAHPSENMIVFDAGESTVRIAVFRADSELPVRSAQSEGGAYITGLVGGRFRRELLSRGARLPGDVLPEAVLLAAEEVKKRLSFDESASADVKARIGAEEKTVRLTLDRDGLDELLSPFSEKLRKASASALRAENMDEGDIDRVIITGGSAFSPSVRAVIVKMFPKAEISVLRDAVSVSRGAAVYACIMRGGAACEKSEALAFDYGTQKVNAADNRLVFTRLLKAGEKFSVDGSLRIIYRLEAGENDVDGGKFIFKLYTRPKGMEHVTSTLSPENAIKYAGRAEAEAPGGFDRAKDAVDFILNIHAGGRITAAAEHLRKVGPLTRIKNRPVRDGMEIVGELKTRFVEAGNG